MKKTIFLFVFTLGAIIYSCKSNSNDTSNTKKLSFTLESKSGSKVTGYGDFTEKNGIVTLRAKIQGLKPGIHAIHIHEKADCSSTDATSAGGHWNPTFKKHGKWGSSEYHKGDIGNFTTDEFGNGTILFKTDEWCIGCGDTTKDITGKGLIVHEKPDDMTTQPSGAAGSRVACAGIIK